MKANDRSAGFLTTYMPFRIFWNISVFPPNGSTYGLNRIEERIENQCRVVSNESFVKLGAEPNQSVFWFLFATEKSAKVLYSSLVLINTASFVQMQCNACYIGKNFYVLLEI